MTSVWHTVLHGGAAAILLAIGLPLLVLSARASDWRPPRLAFRSAQEIRPTLFSAVAILAVGGLTLAVFSAARAADAPAAAAISTIAAILGAVAMHAARRASFNNVATVPLVGLVAIGMLVVVAGPQPATGHAHLKPVSQETLHSH
ncbi:MAG TPA: hypothetical protein VM052_05465 [Candidatus Limnocylindrales bacterium]|nr:hypothetical protein [Candidatus Limnocylindrales bacterium]